MGQGKARKTVAVKRALALALALMFAASCTGTAPSDADASETTAAPPTTTTVPATTATAEPHDATHDESSELTRLCEERVGLPLHELGDFSDDFWGDVYKAEVRAARAEWLAFCGRLMPDEALHICVLLLDDSVHRDEDDYHDQVMTAVAERGVYECDALLMPEDETE